jgi:hypothetical protein
MTSLNDGFGSLRFPAPVVDSAADLDPGHDAIVGLLETAINYELGDAWCAIVASLPANHFLKRDNLSTPVGYVSKVEITPQQMTQMKASWPLLSVYRQGEPEFSQFALNGLDVLKQEWSVDYVIGPLHVGHIVKIGAFCVQVARLIKVVLMHGYHPEYLSGARQFIGQFSSIECKSIQGPAVAAAMTDEAGSGYYGMTVQLETIERTVLDGYTDASTFETYTGYVPVGTGTAELMTEVLNDVGFDNETTD